MLPLYVNLCGFISVRIVERSGQTVPVLSDRDSVQSEEERGRRRETEERYGRR